MKCLLVDGAPSMLQENFTVSVTLDEESQGSSMLQEETQFFNDHIDRIVDRYIGKLVLIKGSRLVGIFETQRAAFSEGTRMFGFEPFLIKRVGQDFRSYNAAPPDACACPRCSRDRFTPLYHACA